MGLQMLPDELLLSIADEWPCRDFQARQIAALLSVRDTVYQFIFHVTNQNSQRYQAHPLSLYMAQKPPARLGF